MNTFRDDGRTLDVVCPPGIRKFAAVEIADTKRIIELQIAKVVRTIRGLCTQRRIDHEWCLRSLYAVEDLVGAGVNADAWSHG